MTHLLGVLLPLLGLLLPHSAEGPPTYWERFNDPALSGWSIRGTHYREDSTRARASMSAVSVQDGILTLRVIPDPEDPTRYLTGHIGTQHQFEFTYGTVTARMKVQPYHGAHAAFWLMPTTDYVAGQAEIDVAEYLGAHDPDRKGGVPMWHNVLYGTDGGLPGATIHEVSFATDGAWYRDFHDYSVTWSPEAYVFAIDGRVVGSITEGLSDAPKYLVLSMLVRDWEVGDLAEHPLGSYQTQVRWVKYWQ